MVFSAGAQAVVFDLNGFPAAGGLQEGVPDFGADREHRGGRKTEDAPVGIIGMNGNMLPQLSGYFIENRFQRFFNGCALVLGHGLPGNEEREKFSFGQTDLGKKPTGFGQIISVVFPVVGDGCPHAVPEAVDDTGNGAGADFEPFRYAASSRALSVFKPSGYGDEVSAL